MKHYILCLITLLLIPACAISNYNTSLQEKSQQALSCSNEIVTIAQQLANDIALFASSLKQEGSYACICNDLKVLKHLLVLLRIIPKLSHKAHTYKAKLEHHEPITVGEIIELIPELINKAVLINTSC